MTADTLPTHWVDLPVVVRQQEVLPHAFVYLRQEKHVLGCILQHVFGERPCQGVPEFRVVGHHFGYFTFLTVLALVSQIVEQKVVK